MNRRTLVMAGLATLPSSLLATEGRAAPRRKPGRTVQAAGQERAALRPARAKFKVVTRTFSNTAPISIPDSGLATPYPAYLAVGGFPSGTIQKVIATLTGVSHGLPADIRAMLVAPNGRAAVIMGETAGFAAVTGLTLVFDDQAVNQPPDPVTSGVYQPTNNSIPPEAFPAPAAAGITGAALAAFIGGAPNGLWQLYVRDQFPDAAGSIAGWSLTIRARIKVPQKPKARPKSTNRATGNRVQPRPKRGRP